MAIDDVKFNPELSNEQLLLLGRVSARASQVEHSGRQLIKNLAGKNYADGLLLTAKGSNMGKLKSMIQKMIDSKVHDPIKALDTTALRELSSVLEILGACSDIRDNIIHFCWANPPAKQIDACLLSEFHQKASDALNAIENFRKPRYLPGQDVEIFTPWSV